MQRSPRQKRASTTHSRSSSASGRSSAPCAKRRQWRYDMNRAAPDPLENMGKPEPRKEARLKVTGEARYGSDMPVRNPAFAFLVTSAIAKGRIDAIDLSEVQAVPGVLDILTHENTKGLRLVKSSAKGGAAT